MRIFGPMRWFVPASMLLFLGTPTTVTPDPPLPPAMASDRLFLSVQHDGPRLRLLWSAPADAEGILHITDANHQSTLHLPPLCVNAGQFYYWPDSKSVSFRLDIQTGGRTLSDAVSLGEPEPPPVATPVANPASRKVPERSLARVRTVRRPVVHARGQRDVKIVAGPTTPTRHRWTDRFSHIWRRPKKLRDDWE